MPILNLYLPFFALGLVILTALAVIILKMGKALADCPISGRAAEAGSLVVVSGFAAIGMGGLSIIAALLPHLHDQGETALFFGLGIAAIALGLGFTQATTVLQNIVRTALMRSKEAEAPGAG